MTEADVEISRLVALDVIGFQGSENVKTRLIETLNVLLKGVFAILPLSYNKTLSVPPACVNP